jgi:hypothetical protein
MIGEGISKARVATWLTVTTELDSVIATKSIAGSKAFDLNVWFILCGKDNAVSCIRVKHPRRLHDLEAIHITSKKEAHSAFGEVGLADSVWQLAALALLHDNVHVHIILKGALKLCHVQAAAQLAQHVHLAFDALQMCGLFLGASVREMWRALGNGFAGEVATGGNVLYGRNNPVGSATNFLANAINVGHIRGEANFAMT